MSSNVNLNTLQGKDLLSSSTSTTASDSQTAKQPSTASQHSHLIPPSTMSSLSSTSTSINPHTPTANQYTFERPFQPSSSISTASSDNNTKNASQIQQPKTRELPTTPSLRKSSGSFESHQFPKTPERTPHQLLPEGTPLLSPTHAYHSSTNNNTTTPSKRSSTDFYNLLKSPEISRNDDIKRRSVELNKIINKSSPDRHNSFIFHDGIMKSPSKLSSNNSSPYRVHKKNDVEIKEISENLKTRLNYANLKIQNGWSTTSINELEKKLEHEKAKKILTSKDKHSYDNFWNLKSNELPTYDQPSETQPSTIAATTARTHVLKGPIVQQKASPRKTIPSRVKLDDLASRKGSAEPALFQALSPDTRKPKLSVNSSPSSKRRSITLPPLQNLVPPASSSSSQNNDNKLEQEAIMSLISLSSPIKYNGSNSPSPPHSSAQLLPSSLPNLNSNTASPTKHSNHHNQGKYQLSKPPKLPHNGIRHYDNASTDDETDPEENENNDSSRFGTQLPPILSPNHRRDSLQGQQLPSLSYQTAHHSRTSSVGGPAPSFIPGHSRQSSSNVSAGSNGGNSAGLQGLGLVGGGLIGSMSIKTIVTEDKDVSMVDDDDDRTASDYSE